MVDTTLLVLMRILDAEINENGDIICLRCGLPNECCECEINNNNE